MHFVRAFDVIAIALSVFAAFLWPCAPLDPCLLWSTIGITIVIITCQGLSLLMFRSSFCDDNPFIAAYGLEETYSSHYKRGPGAKATLSTMTLWSLLIVFELLIYICRWRAEQKILRSAAAEQQVPTTSPL
jgi:hypothetical protein